MFNDPGESASSYSTAISYSQLSSALAALSTPGSSSLPASSSYSGALNITTADEKALGLVTANGSGLDGSIGFSTPLFSKFFYDPTHSLAVPTGYVDFMGIVEHEMSEVMGRISSLSNGNGTYSPLDLFRYSATGVPQTGTGGPAFFSTNGTVTTGSYAFNTTAGADLGDWDTSVGADSFGAYVTNNAVMGVSQADYQVMQAIGWIGSGYLSDSQINPAVTASASVTAFHGGSTAAVPIVDSAANVQAALDTLGTMAAQNALTSITLNDALPTSTVNGLPTLTVTAAQLANDGAAIKLITDNYTLAVTGATATSAAAIAAQAATATGVGDPGNNDAVTIAVVDTTANVLANLSSLETVAQNLELGSITLTDATAPLSVTESAYKADPKVFGSIVNASLTITNVAMADLSTLYAPYHASIIVNDTAANVAANLSAIAGLSTTNGVWVNLTDAGTPVLSVTAAQWDSYRQIIEFIGARYKTAISGAVAADGSSVVGDTTTTMSISDTVANVAANIDTLQSLTTTHVLTGITLTDGGTPILSLTAAQQTADAAAIALITSPYTIATAAPLPLTVAQLITQTAGGQTASTPVVADTVAQVNSHLDLLQTDAAAGTVTSITLTDGGTPELILTPSQLANDVKALSLISGPYKEWIIQETAVAAVGMLSQPKVALVSVMDTPANISASLDGLQTLQSAGKLLAVAFTAGGAISLSPTQLSSDAPVLSDIVGSYQLSVMHVTAGNAASIASQGHVQAVYVDDSAANVAANLDSLETLAASGQMGSIMLTDTATPILTLTAAQLNADGQALLHISSRYSLTATGISVALINSFQGEISSASVSDSSANVLANLGDLDTDALLGKLTSIALTDSGTPSLDVTDSQLADYAAVFQDITGSYHLAVSGVTTSSLSTVLASAHVASAGVTDSAANIGTDLDTLQTLINSGKVTSIALTDSGTPTLSVAAAQMVSDAQAIADISGSYTLAISGASSISQLTPNVLSHAGLLNVSDSAANISSDLDTLQSLAAAGKLTGVAVTGTSYSNLTVTAAQLTSDATVLKELTGNYVLDVTAPTNGGTIAGNAGVGNIVSFSGNVSDYTIAAGANGAVTVTNASGTEHLSHIDAIQIGSQTDIVAQTPIKGGATDTGNLTELYGAVFSRTPDVPGLGFYETFLASNPNTGLLQFATWFLDSTEYQTNPAHSYAQTTVGETQFITDSYQNLLGRTPISDDVNFYLTKVIQPALTGLTPGSAAYEAADNQAHALLLVYFSASPEFLGDVSITAQTPSSTQHWLLLTS